MNETLRISEIFTSIQGETSYVGLPCTFVRLSGCNLHCTYCDTRYAADEEGTLMVLDEVVRQVQESGKRLVCITGGEPLLQPMSIALAEKLIALGQTVLVETNGTMDTRPLPPEAIRIMDVKCPGSGECGSTLPGNIDALRPCDEVKFVLCDRCDFDWACGFVRDRDLVKRCQILFAPVHGMLSGADLAAWILESNLHVRLQMQLHKILWPEAPRGN